MNDTPTSEKVEKARLLNYVGEYPCSLNRQALRALKRAADEAAENREKAGLPEDPDLERARKKLGRVL